VVRVSAACPNCGAFRGGTPGAGLDQGWVLPDEPELIVALDGSQAAGEAVPAAIALARAVGGRLRVVNVPTPGDVRSEAAYSEPAGVMLDRVLATCRSHGVSATAAVLDGFDPAAVLAEDAARRNAAFMVAATHGRTGLARIALGSVVQRLVRRVACPVLVVRPTVLRTDSESEERAGPGSSRRVGAGGTGGEEVRDARRGWRRDRGRPQPSGRASA
jgi:nucleotide-binding universal stress UspA family protein